MKISCKAIFVLLLVVWHCFDATAQPNTPGHAFIYTQSTANGSVYGLYTRDRQNITAAKYGYIEQKNLFFIANEPVPFSYNSTNRSTPLDLYNAWGKFIKTVSGMIPANDSTMIIYTWNIEGAVANYQFFNKQFLIPGPEHKAPASVGYPDAGIAYASGRMVDPGFKLVSVAMPGNMLIISKNGRQGLYSMRKNEIILPPLYDTVMYKADSFFLGWNSKTDYRLIDMKGKEYKSPPVVYEADKINNTATTFGVNVGKQSKFYKVYNSHGKMINTLAMFDVGMNCVVAFKNIIPQYYLNIPYSRSNNIKSYLLDTEGKPLLNPRDNPDSIVIPRSSSLFLIGRYAPGNGENIKYTGIFNALEHKTVAGIDIRAEQDACYERKGDTNYYYNPYGKVIAITDHVPAFENRKYPALRFIEQNNSYRTGLENNLYQTFHVYTNVPDTIPAMPQTGNRKTEPFRFVIDGKAYFRGTEGGYMIPGDDGKAYIFEDIKKLEPPTNYESHIGRNFYLGMVNRKWGIYKIEPSHKEGEPDYSNTTQKITTIAAPEYEEITFWLSARSFLFQLRDNNRKLWIDSSGTVLAGGKDFNYISSFCLPNGNRLAFDVDVIKTGETWIFELAVTRVMMIDAAGNILKEMKCKAKDKISPADFHIVDEEQVIAGNTVYNLSTGKKEKLFNDDYSATDIVMIKGRAVLAIYHSVKTSKPGISTKGGVSYPTAGYHIQTGRRIGNDRGYTSFFNDAIRYGNAIIMEDGTLYGGME
jgi:hypothetical protein